MKNEALHRLDATRVVKVLHVQRYSDPDPHS